MDILINNFDIVLPATIIAIWALVLMFIDLGVAEDKKQLTGWLTLVGIIPALIITILRWEQIGNGFVTNGVPMVISDKFSSYLNVLYLITAFLTVLLSNGYLKFVQIDRSEYYFLMLFSVSGMMLMGMSNDLILVFLALELLSIPLYILSGFDRLRSESEEAALKYFLLGAFSSGFLLFGIALIYGATGSTSLPVIAEKIGSGGLIGMGGVAMLLVGFAFKVGAVPFHMWVPDVYEGAPTTITAFMSIGAKLAGFAAMIRIFSQMGAVSDHWVPAVAVLAAITMIVGNVSAVGQQNLKRMLAYSSIAHAGYIMMAIATIGTDPNGVSAALFYMLTYLFTNIGAFAIAVSLEKFEGKQQPLMLEDLKGLGKRNLGLGLALMYLMMSLIGMPLTGGFAGKFFVLRSAINANLVWLVVIGALTSVISAYYYLRPVFYSFMFDGSMEKDRPMPLSWNFVLVSSVVVTIMLGVLPTAWYELTQSIVVQNLTNVVAR